MSEKVPEEAPPPYSPQGPLFSSGDTTSHFSQLLQQLASQQNSHATVTKAPATRNNDDAEEACLRLLTSEIESLLASVSHMQPTPSVVHATFVPRILVDEGWSHADEDLPSRADEVRTVVQIGGDKGKETLDAMGESSSGETVWWKDEVLAKRLVRRLQPGQPAAASSSLGNASMTLQAEEVSFRRENEMGLWESTAGTAIVVTVRLRS